MIRILLVDDQETVRDAIAAALGNYPDFQVVGGVSTGPEAIERARELAPDLVIIETLLQDGSSIDAARQILAALPATRILAMTSQHADQIVCQAMEAHFSGYFLKKYPLNQLVEAIRVVYNGEKYLSPQAVSAAIAHMNAGNGKTSNGHGAASPLTARELQVLPLLADGLSTKEVAHLLGTCVKTMETHRRRILTKLKLNGIAQLTKYAIRQGLTPL